MVKLIWDKKKDIKDNIENRKIEYKDLFEKVEVYRSRSKQRTLDISNHQNWINKLFWGDNLKVLYYLINNFEEKIDLIYIDPPFFSGANYFIKIKEKDKDYSSVAYYDHWKKDLDSYLQMLYERIILFKRLLKLTGLLFIHADWHASHYIKLILDEVFGQERFVNDIIWYYYNKYSAGKKNLPRAHDNILVYSRSKDHRFNEIRLPRKKPIKQLKREMINGVLKNVKDKNGHVIYRIVNDKKMDDVWKIPCLQPASKQWTGYPTQKHHDLLERIIELGSNEGDLIADFFCGSGTTLLAAEKLKRRWLGSDISRFSIYLTRKRIIEFHKKHQNSIKNLYPFGFYTNLNERHSKIIKNGFFEKKLIIERKK